MVNLKNQFQCVLAVPSPPALAFKRKQRDNSCLSLRGRKKTREGGREGERELGREGGKKEVKTVKGTGFQGTRCGVYVCVCERPRCKQGKVQSSKMFDQNYTESVADGRADRKTDRLTRGTVLVEQLFP